MLLYKHPYKLKTRKILEATVFTARMIYRTEGSSKTLSLPANTDPHHAHWVPLNAPVRMLRELAVEWNRS